MVRVLRPGLLMAALAVLSACASAPTPYGPMAAGQGGYSDEPLDGARYRVTFEGNAATPFERVRQYMVYRAAEVALEAGYTHFVLDSGAVADTVKTVQVDELLENRPSMTYAHNIYGYIISYEPFAPPTGQVRSDQFRVSADITLLRAPPGSAPPVLDAAEVLAVLEPVVRRRPAAP